MKKATTKMVALLRGINVGGNKKVPMQTLRQLAEACGFTAPATYIQSGNLVFASHRTPAQAEAALEKAIAAHFGFTVEVIVRTQAQWSSYAAGSPFPQAQKERPHMLLLGLSKKTPRDGAVERILDRATFGEDAQLLGDGALWIDFKKGAGASKITPAVMDKAAGSTVTTRNWNTVQALHAMLA
ncbi:MAG: DUF1697 domain-containing protein [Myxococcaceae bacterium]|nr:DUF1697 domain-containing protein [Myxococcaceae bacterium]